jgi:hypothetical protein
MAATLSPAQAVASSPAQAALLSPEQSAKTLFSIRSFHAEWRSVSCATPVLFRKRSAFWNVFDGCRQIHNGCKWENSWPGIAVRVAVVREFLYFKTGFRSIIC